MNFFISFQNENRALRLRDGVTVANFLRDDQPFVSTSLINERTGPLPSSDVVSQVSWDYFDEQGYIKRGGLRTGEDPYVRNRFNQQASDTLPSNRDIPDTRNHM